MAVDRLESKAFADLAESVAREAADLAAKRRAEGVEIADRKSSVVDIVTAADREVEALVHDRLRAARPEDGFLGEETGFTKGASGYTWVVDPIDGTVNYLYGSPQYGVSIALVAGDPEPDRWDAVAGVVAVPATGEIFRAVSGAGATLDGRPLRCSTPPSLAETLVATGFGYSDQRRREQIAVLGDVIGSVRDIRRGGAASLDCCAVGAGTVDAYYERGINPWDMAAGSIVAQEAGAIVHTWESSGARSFLFASPSIAAELKTVILAAERAAIG